MIAISRQSALLIASRATFAHVVRELIFGVFLSVCGCGGATSSEPQAALAGASFTMSSSGLGGGETNGEAGGVTSGGVGGASPSAGSGGAESALGGAAGEAAVESPAVSARPKSGTRFCLYDSDCDGLTCTASVGRVQSACLAPCASDLECKPTERCFSQPSIPTSCFQRCVSPEDCDDQFDCADYYRTGEYTCLPSDWVRYWAPIMP
jgi:hypothetical protein